MQMKSSWEWNEGIRVVGQGKEKYDIVSYFYYKRLETDIMLLYYYLLT